MATKRAMQKLQTLVELDERAGMQMAALAGTLQQVVAQMDAILEDADQSIDEILIEATTGTESEFRLSRDPVKAGSVVLFLDGVKVAKTGYSVAGNVITPTTAVPAGKAVRAQYTMEGLKTQTAMLLASMDDLDAAYFAGRRTKYQQAIAWIISQ